MDVTVKAGSKTSVIHSTQHHPFWDVTKGAWVEADHLVTGDALRSSQGASVLVVSESLVLGAADMWDLTVASSHDFYVGSFVQILVHNCGISEAAKIHGNSANSPKPASVYRVSQDGKYLKTGISQNPSTRYSSTFMQDKSMDILAQGPLREMLNLERFIVERDPGPLNFEKWAGSQSDDVP